MHVFSKGFALAAGLAATISSTSAAQQAAPAPRPSAGTLVVSGRIDWIEKSDVAAMREGVLMQIEPQIHDRVEEGEPIGRLHDEMARLTEAKAAVAANSLGAIKRADAQKYVAIARLARTRNLANINPANVSRQEMDEAEAEVAAADAALEEARDNQKLAQAELKLAQQAVKEHIIIAPFTGYVTDRMKSLGEAVQANEAVVRLGRIDKLRFHGYVPLQNANQIHVGDAVEVRAIVEGANMPISDRVFEGKVTGMSREIATVGRSEVQIVAEVYQTDDPDHPELSLRPGMEAQMVVQLSPTARAPSQPVANANAAAPAR